jgi:hypothetical protein
VWLKNLRKEVIEEYSFSEKNKFGMVENLELKWKVSWKHSRLWKNVGERNMCEKQLERVIENTSRLYGDMQGLLGSGMEKYRI